MMPLWGWLLAGLAAAVVLAWAHLAYWTHRYTRPFLPDDRFTVPARDGVKLALHHLRPSPDGRAGGAPVICCHGLACNARTFDFEPGRSLGRTLAAQGFDVYLVDLRGAGASERPAGWRFGFFDYAERDVPAILDFVRARTGRPRVFWVGHSMGGLLGYEQLATPEGEGALAALVAIGSPLHLVESMPTVRFLTRALRRLTRLLPAVHLGLFARFVSPWAGYLRWWPETFFLNPLNAPGRVLRHFMVEVLQDIPRRVLDELGSRLLEDRSVSGRPVAVVRDLLARSAVPTLVMAGAADQIAPVAACDVTPQRAGAEHEWRVLSREAGAPVDFGHLDLIVGDHAPALVYAPVTAFLLARRQRCETVPP